MLIKGLMGRQGFGDEAQLKHLFVALNQVDKKEELRRDANKAFI